jgi:hypothetical protein
MNHLKLFVIHKKEIKMVDHKHGEMDTSTQEKTFNGFISMVTKIAVVIVIALVLLSLING